MLAHLLEHVVAVVKELAILGGSKETLLTHECERLGGSVHVSRTCNKKKENELFACESFGGSCRGGDTTGHLRTETLKRSCK